MKQEKLAEHYQGDFVDQYDQKRAHKPKWKNEHKAVVSFFETLPEGLKVIDTPVGTGRFFDLYLERKSSVTGIDISKDMLKSAASHKAAEALNPTLKEGSIFALEFSDNEFDIAVCTRFLNLVSTKDVEKSLKELARVSRKHVVVGVRHIIPDADNTAGVIKASKQALSRLIKQSKGKIVFHGLSAIESAFEAAGLDIERKEHIEDRQDGTQYNMYLLKKQSDAQ